MGIRARTHEIRGTDLKAGVSMRLARPRHSDERRNIRSSLRGNAAVRLAKGNQGEERASKFAQSARVIRSQQINFVRGIGRIPRQQIGGPSLKFCRGDQFRGVFFELGKPADIVHEIEEAPANTSHADQECD